MEIGFINYIYATAGLTYLIFIILQRNFSARDIAVSVLPLSLLFFRSRDVYFPLLSLISILQAFVFIKRRTPFTASKYFLYSFLFLLCGSMVLDGIYKEALFITLILKALISDQDLEIDTTSILHSNMLITLSALMNYHGFENMVVSLMVFGAFALACIRGALDNRIKTPVYLGSIFILFASTSPLYAVAIFIYVLTLNSISTSKNKADQLLLIAAACIPLIDGSIFQSVVPLIGSKWIAVATAVIAALSISLFIEYTKMESSLKIRAKHIFLFLLFIALGCFNSIWELTPPHINLPIPMLTGILFIALNGFYIKASKKTKIGSTITAMEFSSKNVRQKKESSKGPNENVYINVLFVDDILSKTKTGSLMLVIMISISITILIYRWLA